MLGWFQKKPTEEEDYLEDLERRKRGEAAEGPFRLVVADVFTIRGRRGGTVVTGQVSTGRVRCGDRVTVHGAGPACTLTVDGIETFRKMVDSAGAGEKVGLLFRGPGSEQLEKGDVLTAGTED